MGQNDNNGIPQAIMTYCENTFDSENNNMVITGPQVVGTYTQFYVAYWPKSDTYNCYGEINSNGYQWSLYKVGNFTVTYREIKYKTSSGPTSNISNNPYSNTYFTNRNSSLYSTSINWVSNYRIYRTNTVGADIILNYGYLPPNYFHGEGHAIAPSLDSPQYPTGATVPHEVPQFHTWNSYTWNTYNPPSFDTSTLESMIESLGDIIQYNAEYIADGISGAIENLGNNLKNYIEDLGNIFKYYGDLISGNIKDFAENIYDNIQELLEPIYTVVDLFVKPWDSEEFQQQLNESSFYGSLDTTITQIRSFGTSLTQASEPENLTFTINLTGIGWGISEIDFNWIKPFRSIIRLIIGCVLVYWLAIELITGINNVIGSGGDNEE